MKKIHFVIIAAALIFAATDASAALKLHSTISDGMVLQQCTQARIWGTTDPGASVRVSVSWDSRNYSVVAGDDGKWEIKVCTPEASYTAHSIVVKSAGTTMTVRDVLVGEVWLGAGQSNMHTPLNEYWNDPETKALKEGKFPSLRLKSMGQLHEGQNWGWWAATDWRNGAFSAQGKCITGGNFKNDPRTYFATMGCRPSNLWDINGFGQLLP